MESNTFEQMVVDLVKSLSPQKRDVFIPPDSLQELKEVVRTSILAAPKSFLHTSASLPIASTSSTKNDYYAPEDEDSRMSSCDSSEDSRSVSNDDESSRGGRNKGSKSNGFSMKQSNRVKRLQELRQVRRKQTQTDEKHEFACTEKEFSSRFLDWYETSLDEQTDALTFFHVIVNSIADFFAKITWGSNIVNLTCSFITRHLLRTINQFNTIYECGTRPFSEKENERRLLETKVHILLELHTIALKNDESDVEPNISEVAKKLHFIYIFADPLRMRNFLEEQVTDNFSHLIPKVLVNLYDDLCITLPADLEEFDPNPELTASDAFKLPWFQTKSNESNEQTKQLEKILDDMAETGVTEKENNTKSQKIKKEIVNGKKSSPPPASPSRKSTRIPRVVPETPEDKMFNVKQEPDDDGYDEIVKQTPIGKLRGANKKTNRRLSDLVKISEERVRLTRSTSISCQRTTRSSISTTVAANVNKQLLLGMNTPSPRPHRSARSNLIDRFKSTPDAAASPAVLRTSPRKSSVNGKTTKPITDQLNGQPERKRAKLQSFNVTSSFSCPIVGFGASQLERYKLRMNEIDKTKDISSCEVRQRTSLYEGLENDDSQVDNKTIQKNRTGRTVRNSTTVHLAHILLNVHNPSPLSSFKASKLSNTAQYRLQRLVRIAKKREKQKLMKLRQRVRFNHVPSPSSSQTSDLV